MNINHASAEDLERAFEVDGERAHYIIDKRNQLGGFSSWEQIKQEVPSIEDQMIENLRNAGMTIEPATSRGQSGQEHRHPGAARGSDKQTRSANDKDVNTASREQLEHLCQIDGDRADYFLQKREEVGGFNSWEEIKDTVRSFDSGMIERMKKAGFGFGERKNAA